MFREARAFAREDEPSVNGAKGSAHYFLIDASEGALNGKWRELG